MGQAEAGMGRMRTCAPMLPGLALRIWRAACVPSWKAPAPSVPPSLTKARRPIPLAPGISRRGFAESIHWLPGVVYLP